MNNKNFRFARIWIKITTVLVSILVIVGAAFYYSKINSSSSNNSQFIISNYKGLTGSAVIIFVLITWLLMKTLVCNVALFKYSSLPDTEFIANKWSLAVLSLTVSGFVTPFVLAWLPNVDSKSTKNARVTIVKVLGLSWALGALGVFAGLLIIKSTLTGAGVQQWAVNGEKNFNTIVIVFASVFVLCGLCCVLFAGERASNSIKTKTGAHIFYSIIIYIFLVIVTVELIIQMVSAVLVVIADIGRAFNAQGIEKIFAIFQAIFAVIRAAFLIWIISKVLQGLWSPKQMGFIEFGENKRFAKHTEKSRQNA